jgi:hypothetical protein
MPVRRKAAKQCKWVDREPIYVKMLTGPHGTFHIDKSEWVGDKGAFFRYKETVVQVYRGCWARLLPTA